MDTDTVNRERNCRHNNNHSRNKSIQYESHHLSFSLYVCLSNSTVGARPGRSTPFDNSSTNNSSEIGNANCVQTNCFLRVDLRPLPPQSKMCPSHSTQSPTLTGYFLRKFATKKIFSKNGLCTEPLPLRKVKHCSHIPDQPQLPESGDPPKKVTLTVPSHSVHGSVSMPSDQPNSR